MSAFQQALANSQAQPSGSGSGSSLSIKGSAGDGPSGRTLGSALRQAGLAPGQGMEVDGGRGSRSKRVSVHGARSGPLDQTGRHRPPKTPYGKPQPPGNQNEAGRPVRSRASSGLPAHPHAGGKVNFNNSHHSRRQPEGTPPILKKRVTAEDRQAQASSHAKLSEKLKSEEMKSWLRSKVIQDGVMNMANLGEDQWLKSQGILPPGDKNAPPTVGTIFWKLIDEYIQKPTNTPIHTLSLANNNFHSLRQLERLPFALPHLRALDLSNNPVQKFFELDALLAQGEKKGKATAGIGGLKSLTELKLNGCTFREETLKRPKGDDTYKHEILRRFPGLLILDGVNLDRIVFPIHRQPQIRRSEAERQELRKKPFSFPMDTQPGFIDNDIVRTFVMQFCQKYFPLFDTDRSQLLPAYANNATVSISANTLISRSYLQQNSVLKTRTSRPNPIGFDAWTALPGRNFLRTATSIEQRMKTLKSPMDSQELLRWWTQAVPKSKHPLEDPAKWCIDAWVLGGEGVDTRLSAMIQGEFQEMPSGTYRSFSRTFILADAPQGSTAHNAGWPATVLSDTMIVHSYMSSGAFDDNRTLAQNGVAITPPAAVPSKDLMIAELSNKTGMNAQFAEMCLNQNGWVFDTAMKNFEEIKSTIPPEAFR